METNVVQKSISLLVALQEINTTLYSIERLKGNLPLELEVLDTDISQLSAKVLEIRGQISNLENLISQSKVSIKDCGQAIDSYSKQQMGIRNNREYDAISKEIDIKRLDIKLFEKKIKSYYEEIDANKVLLDQTLAAISEKKQLLDIKKNELNSIIQNQKQNTELLNKNREELLNRLDPSLLVFYNRILNNVKNKVVIVPVNRDACGGCFNLIPYQVQIEVKNKEKIVFCEHCSRILSDVIVSE